MVTKYIKKPIKTKVEFATNSGELETLEGTVKYQLGDALITGVAGEQWPINRTQFEQSYRPVTPVNMGQSGNYLKNRVQVEARQTNIEENISIAEGMLHAKKGDWIVSAPDGKQWVVADLIFRETYQRLD